MGAAVSGAIPTLIDTGVLIHRLTPDSRETGFSALSLAELEHGVAAAAVKGMADEVRERARVLDRARSAYGHGLPFTGEVTPAYGRVIERARRAGLPSRRIDYLIVATAVAHGMPFLTTDRMLAVFDGLTDVVVVEPRR